MAKQSVQGIKRPRTRRPKKTHPSSSNQYRSIKTHLTQLWPHKNDIRRHGIRSVYSFQSLCIKYETLIKFHRWKVSWVYKPAIEEEKDIEQILFCNETIYRLYILLSKEKNDKDGDLKEIANEIKPTINQNPNWNEDELTSSLLQTLHKP